MADKRWKRHERKVARFFGALRTPLSGGASRHTASDTLHGRLFVETKSRKRHAVVELWKRVRQAAKREGKLPVVALTSPGERGFWIVVHCDDLDDVFAARWRQKAESVEG